MTNQTFFRSCEVVMFHKKLTTSLIANNNLIKSLPCYRGCHISNNIIQLSKVLQRCYKLFKLILFSKLTFSLFLIILLCLLYTGIIIKINLIIKFRFTSGHMPSFNKLYHLVKFQRLDLPAVIILETLMLL